MIDAEFVDVDEANKALSRDRIRNPIAAPWPNRRQRWRRGYHPSGDRTMPRKQKQRKYLMISAVAERFEIHPQTLRAL